MPSRRRKAKSTLISHRTTRVQLPGRVSVIMGQIAGPKSPREYGDFGLPRNLVRSIGY